MVEQYYPSTTELMRQQRARRTMVTGLLVATVILVFGIMGAFMLLTNIPGPAAWLLGLVAFVAMATPVVVWHHPRGALYFLFAAAFVAGGAVGQVYDPLMPTTYLPFWWNISMIAQSFGQHALDGISVSPAEIVMILTTLTWIIKGVVARDLKVWRGPMLSVMLCYVAFVTFGFFYGRFRGGDITVALWEIRTQFHLLLIYILAGNLITERKQVLPLFTIAIVGAVIQSCGAVVKYMSLPGAVDDAGFMTHDISFIMVVAFFMCMLLIALPWDRRYVVGALAAMPIIIAGILVNNRRGAVGAAVVAFMPLVPLLWSYFKPYRQRIASFGVVIGLVSAIYFPIAWNGNGPWALPARALRSQTDPNERDAGSNNYRYVEDYDLKFTRDLQPWTGIGYGRMFAQPIPLPEIAFPMKDYLPHNGILWVWMRIGHFGFLAFLMMLFTIIIKGLQSLRRVSDIALKSAGLMGVLCMAMLFVYSKYDMQLISSRTVVACFALVGALSAISRFGAGDGDSAGETDAGQGELERAAVGV